MAIPAETIEQVASANDIVEVINTYFPLTRAGSAYKALCPFHQEKTPSFTVSPQRQTFHCFGCGVGGSVFRFVMDYEHIEFPTAVQKLADRAGIRIVEERSTDERQHEARRTLLKLHAEATEWFHQNLLKRDGGAPARAYLKTRGISSEVAKRWKLGFAPDSWSGLAEWASAEGYLPKQLLGSGLVKLRDENRSDGEFYDRFRNRLIFPICNDIGEVVAFSGRLLDSSATAAKYLNSPETPLFRKGHILFGLEKTKRALIEAERAIVCEGQLDLITLFEAGITNVVAPQGTAFTEAQARVLRHFVREVVLCFDADPAGQQATERSLAALLENELAVRVAEMPPGEDPDSLVRSAGREQFEALIESARDFFDYWLEKRAHSANLDSASEKMSLARELAGTVASVRAPIMRGQIISKIAARLSVRTSELEELVKQSRPSERRGPASGPEKAASGPAPSHELAMLCLLALRDDEARFYLREQDWRDILDRIPGTELLTKILAADLLPSQPPTIAAFCSELTPTEEASISAWMVQKLPNNAVSLAREWWQGVVSGVARRDLELAESRLRLPNLTSGEIMQLQKQVLDLREQLHDLHRSSPARAHHS